MNRRRALEVVAGAASIPLWARGNGLFQRRRPSDPRWPSKAAWARLDRATGGRLIAVRSPLAACASDPHPSACDAMFQNLRNPYYIGDQPGVTQTLAWVDAWTTEPSVYAVAAGSAADIAAAVNFARENDLRVVVKGGGHSYLGTSNAPDSLLIWTRRMNDVTLHDAFVPLGCAGSVPPQRAATIGAGAMWIDAYSAVTTQGGGYVQGGGCATVGVAGLIQSGGFGSFSKHYGLAAAGLLEAEVVTADGAIRIANACTNPELFWALKGGGGGSFGVVSKLTLRVRDLPEFFGGADFTVKAASDAAFHALTAAFVDFYRDRLFNEHWGEQATLRHDNTLAIGMVAYGLSGQEMQAVWQPFLDWVASRPGDYSIASPPIIGSVPARNWWNRDFIEAHYPSAIVPDSGPGARPGAFWWSGDGEQVAQVLNAYQSLWLPAALLEGGARARFVDALFRASRHWGVAMHFNKGLAGAPADAIAAANDTATNPEVLSAFALAIVAASGPPAYPGIPGHEPDATAARSEAARVTASMNELRAIVPGNGSYLSESDYFQPKWQQAYWGINYPRLADAKATYDPQGLFFVHHGVGSEQWSADGFTRI